MERRLITIAGLTAWLAIGIPIMIDGADSFARMAGWFVAFVRVRCRGRTAKRSQ